MNKLVGTFTKGIAAGMIVGTAVGMISNPLTSRKRSHMKKNAGKALRAVGELIQNAQYMMK
jgi:gas vesicle protein